MDDSNSAQTVKELKKKVAELEKQIEQQNEEYNNLTMDVALTVSEFFQVLQGLNKGDFEVRAPEDSSNELLANFGKTINETVKILEKETREREEANRKTIEKSMELIKRQQSALAEMSTPMIQVWDRVLCLPVVGIIDSKRSSEMMETLLNKVIETECRCVIVDITGVDVVDTQTADYFIKMIKAANLLGAYCVVTGISAEIAQTITQIGVDLSGIQTLRNLRDGLIESFRILNLKVVPDDKKAR